MDFTAKPAGLTAKPAGLTATPAGSSATPAGLSATPVGPSATPVGPPTTSVETHAVETDRVPPSTTIGSLSPTVQGMTRTHFGIRHSVDFFADLKQLDIKNRVGDIELNMDVEVFFAEKDTWRSGVCRWLGEHEKDGLVVGVELDQNIFEGSSDGLFPLDVEDPKTWRLFSCRDKHGILVSRHFVRKNVRNPRIRDAEKCAYRKLDERLKAGCV